MTRFSLLFIAVILLSSFANQAEFPVNDIGRYELSEVVELSGMDKETLYENGKKFMKKVKVLNSKNKFFTENKEAYTITNRGSFYVYRLGSVKKGIDGAVEYDLKLEVKDGKYRYSITNFVFNQYERNRYGKYQPVKGKYRPLEVEVSSLNKKEWEKQKQVVFDKSQELIENLFGDMVYAETKKEKKAKKDDNW